MDEELERLKRNIGKWSTPNYPHTQNSITRPTIKKPEDELRREAPQLVF
jgi:hypothetical protein